MSRSYLSLLLLIMFASHAPGIKELVEQAPKTTSAMTLDETIALKPETAPTREELREMLKRDDKYLCDLCCIDLKMCACCCCISIISRCYGGSDSVFKIAKSFADERTEEALERIRVRHHFKKTTQELLTILES